MMGGINRPDGVLSGKQCCHEFRAPRIRVHCYRVSRVRSGAYVSRSSHRESGSSSSRPELGLSSQNSSDEVRWVKRYWDSFPDYHTIREGLSIAARLWTANWQLSTAGRPPSNPATRFGTDSNSKTQFRLFMLVSERRGTHGVRPTVGPCPGHGNWELRQRATLMAAAT